MTRTDGRWIGFLALLVVLVSYPGSYAGTVILPVVANGSGLAGSEWRTAIGLHVTMLEGEAHGSPAGRVELRFHRGDRAPVSSVSEYPIVGISQWTDPRFLTYESMFGVGALIIEAGGDRQWLVSARIYDWDESVPEWEIEPALGQEVPGLRPEDLLQSGERGGAIGGGDPDSSRTNFGWYQHEAGTVTFRRVWHDGQPAGPPVTADLVAHSHFQASDFFDQGSVGDLTVDGYPELVIAEVESGSGIGYLSVVDDETNDATFRLFQRMTPARVCDDAEDEAGVVILPVIANAPGRQGSRWRTSIGFHASLRPGEEPGADIGPMEATFYPAVGSPVSWLVPGAMGGTSRWFPADELDRVGVAGAGALVVELPAGHQPLAFARVFHDEMNGEDAPPAVRGEEIPGLRPRDLLQAGERGGVVDLDEVGEFRTNLGWYQHEAGRVRFSRLDDFGTQRGQSPTTLELPANSFFQVRKFLGSTVGVWAPGLYMAEVLSGSGIGYLSVIDDETNEATFRLFQKMDPAPACEGAEE